MRGFAASRQPRRCRSPRFKHLKFRKPSSGIYHDADVRFWRLWRTDQQEYGRGHSTVAVRLPSSAKPSHFCQHHGCAGSFRTKVCPKCGWRGTENSGENAAGFWQNGGLCAERQCPAAEKRRKKKENDTAIETEVQENWAECDSCQKWRLLPSTCIVTDGAPF